MRAAIYARVSTDEQANSIETQEREGRRYAESRGWHVVEVYRDEGASGAEWVNRPEIARAIRDAGHSPRPWDVLLVRDQDRLGRDAARTVLAIEAILEGGARVVEYSTGHEAKSDPMARMMVSMRGAFGELERAMIAKRTRDAHEAMARQGRVTGGRVYGYTNVRTPEGVRHVIDPEQAAIIRQLFDRHGAGESVRVLAADLNRRGIPSPFSRHPGAGTWSPSVLHAILHRPRYLGRIEWGRKRKGYKGGTRVRTDQADAEVLTIEQPDLRIVSDAQWAAVQARGDAYRGAHQRPAQRAPARYLLVGLVRCAGCGGPIASHLGKWGASRRALYCCGWHHNRGASVCPVSSQRPADEVDDAVITWVRENVLSPAVVREVLASARRRVEEAARAEVDPAEVRRVDREIARLEGEQQRMVEAIARGGGAIDLLVRAATEREGRLAELRGHRARLDAPREGLLSIPWPTLVEAAAARVAELGELLRGDIAGARKALGLLLDGTLTFAPVGAARATRWSLSGRIRTGGMFVSPGGVEPPFAT